MKTKWYHLLIFNAINILFWIFLGLIYSLIYDYDISAYLTGYINGVVSVMAIVLMLSSCVGLLLNWGLKDGRAVSRIIKLQGIFTLLFFIFWVYNIYLKNKERVLEEQTNECLENNKLMITIAFYNGEKVDSVYNVMKNIERLSPTVDSTLLAIIESSELLDKRVKCNAVDDVDTIYCINKGDIITETSIRHNKTYTRTVLFEYELTRKKTFYRAKYLWSNDECICDSLIQLN